MNKPLLALCLALSLMPAATMAQERVTLGWGRLLTNDLLGDGRDRWRTGSYTLSRIRGEAWSGSLPATPGEILEFRAMGETIAPADLTVVDPNDRRFVGALTFGLHTHFEWSGLDTSLGANLVITGPQSGASNVQGKIHDLLGLPEPQVYGLQIGDAVYPTAVAEVGKRFALPHGEVRPLSKRRPVSKPICGSGRMSASAATRTRR